MIDRLFKDMPPRIAALPRNDRGFPIPYFAEEVDGIRDFRIVSAAKMAHAVRNRRCWACGGTLGKFMAFVIGPMCAINRVISDPPSHRDCAIFSARNCPFLSSPLASRRSAGMPEGYREAPGHMIKRNPGAVGVWVTLAYSTFRAPHGNAGMLFSIGEPVEVLWFAEGKPATRQQIDASIDSGFPELEKAAALQGPLAVAALASCRAGVEPLLPAT